MENEVSKGNNKLVWVLVFFIVLSLSLGSYVIYDAFIAKDEVKDDVKDDDKKKENDENKPEEQTPYEKFISEEKNKREAKVIYKSDEKETDPYEIRLTANGEVYADVKAILEDRKDITNELLENQVVKYFIVDVGRRDTGFGQNIVFLKEDGSISTVSLDTLLLLNKIDVVKNVGSLKNIVDVYSKVTTPATEFEPAGYSVYAKDIDGKETDISSFMEESRK